MELKHSVLSFLLGSRNEPCDTRGNKLHVEVLFVSLRKKLGYRIAIEAFTSDASSFYSRYQKIRQFW